MTEPMRPNPRDRVGFLAEAIRELQLWWRLLRDGRVPLWVKCVPFLALLYILFPFDLVADPLLGLGQLDDLAILVLGMEVFVALSPSEVVAQIRREIRFGRSKAATAPGRARTVDASYRVVDEGALGDGQLKPGGRDD